MAAIDNNDNRKIKKKKKSQRLQFLSHSKERQYFFDDLSMMLESGTPIEASLAVMAKNFKQNKMKQLAINLLDDIDSGKPLWQSLQDSKEFSDYAISLARVGEESGQLSQNLQIIAVHEEKQRLLKSKIRSAVAYPAFVIAVTIFVAIGAVWFIFPKLSNVFASLHAELPITTRFLIGSGKFMQANGIFVILALSLTSVSLWYLLFKFPKTKNIGDELVIHLPGIGKLRKEIEIERFGFLLGTLLNSGLTITSSFDSLIKATDFYPYKKLFKFMAYQLESGDSFENTFDKYGKTTKLFPSSVIEMIIAGEKSGRLPNTLTEIGLRYGKKTDVSSQNLTQMIEPVLLVIVWLGVLGIALSVIVPVYGLIGGLNDATNTNTTTQTVINSQKLEVVGDTSAKANIYNKASETANVIKIANTGESYEYKTTLASGWYEISLPDGQVGWIKVGDVKLLQ